MFIHRFTALVLLFLLAACGGGGSGGGGGGRDALSGDGVTQPASQYAGTWRGTFSGTDSGSWEARVDLNGRITATGRSRNAGAFTATGRVSPAGEFTMTASGGTTTGARFTGMVGSDGNVAGGWTNVLAGGAFSGEQITVDNRVASQQITGSFPGFGSLQPNRVITIPAGDAIQGSFATTASGAVTGSFGFGAVSANLELTTDERAAPRAVALTSGGRQFALDPASDGTQFLPGTARLNILTWLRTTDGRNTVFTLTPAGPGDFDYLGFGFWEDAAVGGTSTLVGAAAFGAPTAASAMPRTGRAVYRGAMTGFYATRGEPHQRVGAAVRMAVDFQRQRIDFATQRTSAGTDRALPALDMTGEVSIDGARFAGTAATAGGLRGPVRGRFYGPGAVEAGGILDLVRDDTERLTAAFGARRD